MSWLVLVARLSLDPRLASHVGAALAGEPQLGPVLVDIARRESRLELVGLHARDGWMSRSLGEGCSTRGVHGQVPPFALQYGPAWMHGQCWLLSVPLVSAYLGAKRAAHWRCRATAGCRSWLGREPTRL